MQHINLSAISWENVQKAPNLEIFLQSKLKLDAEEGVGRLGSASGHELMIYEAPSLYSCIDRIRLNDCNLYFIRWISALYYTGGDNRLNMGSSTGAAESFLVSFFLFVMMMMVIMMMMMKKGNLPFTSSISRGNVRAQQHDNINGPGHLFSMIFILGPLYWS